jgi:hypothetical protein
MHAYIHTHTHTYIHTYIHTHIHTYIHKHNKQKSRIFIYLEGFETALSKIKGLQTLALDGMVISIGRPPYRAVIL